MLDLVVQRIHESGFLASIDGKNIEASQVGLPNLDYEALVASFAYHIQTITNLIRAVGSRSPTILNTQSSQSHSMDAPASKSLKAINASNTRGDNSADSIRHVLLRICHAVLAAEQPTNQDVETHHETVLVCVQLLTVVIPSLANDVHASLILRIALIKSLNRSLDDRATKLTISLSEALKLLLETIDTGPIDQVESDARPASADHQDLKGNDEKLSQDPDRSDGALISCLTHGFDMIEDSNVLEQWVQLLELLIPSHQGSIFQVLLPLVDCLITSITRLFEEVQSCFGDAESTLVAGGDPLQRLNLLFNALELLLAKGHDQISKDEAKKLNLPEPSQGYLGNMVTGLFTTEAQPTRPATANDRLSVLLCFRDSVKISYRIWSWDSDSSKTLGTDPGVAASFNYVSVRLRNRSRRILDNLFGAEILECLEVIVELWAKSPAASMGTVNVLHALEATRPKYTMPTMFNALYSRTNPAVLDAFRQSTLTLDISEIQLARFLLAYTRSIDDDALDEVWVDCVAFTREVLSNPMPQRQILPFLLEFISVLSIKIENTNFGELRRMRRDIGVSLLHRVVEIC